MIDNKILEMGFKIPRNIRIHESIRLYEKDKNKSSAILTRYDEDVYGLYNFKTATHTLITTDDYKSKSKEEVEKEIKRRKYKEDLRKFEIVKKAQHLTKQYELMKEVVSHPYLTKKGLTNAKKARVDRYNNLVVPVYNTEYPNHLIVSLQTIDASGNKRFVKGQPMSKSYLELN